MVEATGGYENKLLDALVNKSVKYYKADSKMVYNYLRSLNKFCKTDNIDAKGLSRYVKERSESLQLYETPSTDQKILAVKNIMINQLKSMTTQEKTD